VIRNPIMATTGETRHGRCGRWAVAAIVAVTCVRVWLGPDAAVPQACAQIPDSGLQRKQMLEESARTNQLLEQILDTLQTRTLKVSVEGQDGLQEKAAVPHPRKP
jgi:hypothetical protein